MHAVEVTEQKAESAQVVVRYTDQRGTLRQGQVPLTNLAAIILNSVNQRAQKRDREGSQSYAWESSK
jgi:hypothetical protein